MAQGHNAFVTDCDNDLYCKEQSLNLELNVNSSQTPVLFLNNIFYLDNSCYLF